MLTLQAQTGREPLAVKARPAAIDLCLIDLFITDRDRQRPVMAQRSLKRVEPESTPKLSSLDVRSREDCSRRLQTH